MVLLEIIAVALIACAVGYFMGTKMVNEYLAEKKLKEEAAAAKKELQEVRKRMVGKTKYPRCLDCRFNYAEPTELEQRHCQQCNNASNWELL